VAPPALALRAAAARGDRVEQLPARGGMCDAAMDDASAPSPGDALAAAMAAGPLPKALAVSDEAPAGVPAHAARHALWATAGGAFRAALAFQGARAAALAACAA
jgi:hypothetical protein